MAKENTTNTTEATTVPETPAVTPMPGLTATMEIAGAESIPGATPDKVILGFARED